MGNPAPHTRFLTLPTVFLDRPVRREISRIEKWSRRRQRRMTLNNSMSITPMPPA